VVEGTMASFAAKLTGANLQPLGLLARRDGGTSCWGRGTSGLRTVLFRTYGRRRASVRAPFTQ